jgi:Mg2+ and Co2+ transporter CorA
MPAYEGPGPWPGARPTYEEYLQVLQAAEKAATENIHLRQSTVELEERLQAVELTRERIGDLGEHQLTRLAHHYQALVEAIVDELRARHLDVSVELIEPRVRDLEEQLVAAKERAWDARQQLHESQQENMRLVAALQKLADVQPEQGLGQEYGDPAPHV